MLDNQMVKASGKATDVHFTYASIPAESFTSKQFPRFHTKASPFFCTICQICPLHVCLLFDGCHFGSPVGHIALELWS